RELDPDASALDQAEEAAEGGMLGRHGLEELPHMVDDDAAGPVLDLCFALGQEPSVQLKLHVPADRLHTRRDLIKDIPRYGAARQHVKARPTDARLGEALELAVADARVHDRDAARALEAEGGNARERAAVV